MCEAHVRSGQEIDEEWLVICCFERIWKREKDFKKRYLHRDVEKERVEEDWYVKRGRQILKKGERERERERDGEER